MRRLFLFVLAVLVLAGCGGSPDADQNNRATTISGGSPVAQTTAAPTAGSVMGATSGPTSGTISAPTITPDVAAGRAQQEYNSLIVLKAAANLLGEAARPRPTPASASAGEAGAGIEKSIATLLKAAGDKLKLDKPDTSLEEVWPQAREAHSSLLELHGRWTDKKVTPVELTGELEPIQKRLDEILDTAEDGITSRYGGDARQFQQRRQEAVQSLVSRFVAPTP